MSGWQDHSSIPMDMLGDDASALNRRRAKKTNAAYNSHLGRSQTKRNIFERASWELLEAVMRCWVVEPFDGPWTAR